MWLSFIERVNGSCSFGKNIWLSNREITLYTDSAGNPELVCGEYFSGRWTFFQWLQIGVILRLWHTLLF